MVPRRFETGRDLVPGMSPPEAVRPGPPSAVAATQVRPLAGLTLGVDGRLDGLADVPVEDALAAGATLGGRALADAVAALRGGLCDAVLASDRDGALRRDAGRFGLFGIRRSSLPPDGAASLDGWGFLARDGAGFARLAETLLREAPAPLPERPRCVIAADVLAGLDLDIRAALAPVIGRIEDLLGRADMIELAPGGFGPLVSAFRQLRADGPAGPPAPDGPGGAASAFGPDVRDDDDRDEAEESRAAFRARLGRLLAGDRVILLPTLPDIDPRAAPGPPDDATAACLCPAALAGLPQVSVPLARLDDAPLGLSLLGPAGSDLSLCRIAIRLARDIRRDA